MNKVNKDFIIPDHGITEDSPIRVKHDIWNTEGPGQRDMHFELEFGIVRRGSMARTIGDDRLEYNAGDVWFSGIWELHAADVLAAPLELVMLHIHPSALLSLHFPEAAWINWLTAFSVEPELRPRSLAKDKSYWSNFSRRILAINNDGWHNMISLRLLLMEALLKFGDFWEGRRNKEGKTLRREGFHEVFVQVFSRSGFFPVSEAAALAGMDRNSFARIFREITGISFAEFSLRHRLSGARNEMLQTDSPVKAIARKWGFSDSSHFHKQFKKSYDITPQEFRKKYC